MGPKLHI